MAGAQGILGKELWESLHHGFPGTVPGAMTPRCSGGMMNR